MRVAKTPHLGSLFKSARKESGYLESNFARRSGSCLYARALSSRYRMMITRQLIVLNARTSGMVALYLCKATQKPCWIPTVSMERGTISRRTRPSSLKHGG